MSTAAVPETSLNRTKSNLKYLVNPSSSAPKSLVSRSSLNTLRYVLKFAFYRLLRYGKYALIAAGATALGGTVIGTALPWVGALVFPSLPVAAAMGATTALIKFTWRHRGNHFRREAWLGARKSGDPKQDEAIDATEASRDWERKGVHPRANRAWQNQDEFS
ncbi:uncharacterized protein JCM6883_002250 [Sporobolomyces salmoneus]|uniref:uncharacterized protein n=1 Tax=Sporobolomyces salmoneus TaxID=183962 RepID=UPI003174BD8D